MVKQIIDLIKAEIEGIANVYGIAEKISDQYGVYLSNGEFRPVLYKEPSEGLVYFRQLEKTSVENSEELAAIGCEDYQKRTYPMRVVAVQKRSKAKPELLAGYIAGVIEVTLNRSQRQALKVSEAYTELKSFETDMLKVVEEELMQKPNSALSYIYIDFNVVVAAEASCFKTDCYAG